MRTIRRLAALMVAAALLFTVVPVASAAVVTNCQDVFFAPKFAGAESHRTSTYIQAVRGDWTAQDANDPYLKTCIDSGNSDGESAASMWIAIAGSGPSEIMQMGVARCASGCNDLANAGNDSNGNPIEGIPNDNTPYLFWTWGGRAFADGPIGLGPMGIKIAAWNGTVAPKFAILRTCNQTDCTDPFYRAWYFVWSQDGTSIEDTLAGSPVNFWPGRGWVQLDEWNVPWADGSEATKAKFICEQWDSGDQCGGYEPAGLQQTIAGIKVKDWDGVDVPFAWSVGWVNPKLNSNQSCDLAGESWMSCQTYTSSGGNPENRFGSVRLETFNNR